MIQIDEIGILYESPALDAKGQPIAPPQPLAGWHVNATHPVAGWGAHRIAPTSPRRVFGGAPTVHYTFPSQPEYLAWLSSADLRLPVPVPIPASVTMRQARLALLAAGVLDAVAPGIAALLSPQKEAAQIEWEYSQTVERHRPFVLLLGVALGLDAPALDALFIAAAAL